jgi:four helix bundle protein
MRFENFSVWQLSIEFTTEIYELTHSFPKNEIYGITSQLRRASSSIALNIAEGSGRTTDKEFSRFIDYSIGSTLECVSAFHICRNLEYIDAETFDLFYKKAELISKKLYAFKRRLK